MLEWPKLIEERNAWVAHNFPNHVGGTGGPVIGCIEELGELAHAHLKQDQKIRGDDNQHIANAKDAIGDLIIYLFGIVARSRPPRDFFSLKQPTTAEQALLFLAEAVGRMARHSTHSSTTGVVIEYERAVDSIVHYANAYCELRGWDFEEIVQSTWDGVKQRDWIKYPDTGLPPAEPVKATNFLVQAGNIPAFKEYKKGDILTIAGESPLDPGKYRVLADPVDSELVIEKIEA